MSTKFSQQRAAGRSQKPASAAAQTEPFTGFPEQTLAFLRALGAHNDKAWFDDHRADHERDFLAPALSFIAAMAAPLRAISPGIRAEPRANGSLMRIHRDVRFSRDKRPYKDHIDLLFWEGTRRSRECPCFFFRLTADALLLGAGKHGFDAASLATYRAAVADDKTGPALVHALAQIRQAGDYELGGAHYQRVPRGYPADHPRADLLRHNALYVHVDLGLPAEVHSAALVDLCAAQFGAVAPLHQWLVAVGA